MKKTNILAALLLMAAGVQTTCAQKVVFHLNNGDIYECNVSKIDSMVVVNKYETDNMPELLPQDDAATVDRSHGWQMPILTRIQELYNSSNTTTEWTTQNGVKGNKFTGKNGNSIFLPEASHPIPSPWKRGRE